MNWIKILELSISLVLPVGIIFGFVYLLIRNFLLESRKIRELELKKEYIKQSVPIRIQAHERLALFLERICPEAMIRRTNYKSMTVEQLRLAFIADIREEFEHNISQQIYVSEKTWMSVSAARASIVSLVNDTAVQSHPKEPASELVSDLLENYSEGLHNPINQALDRLRNEVQLFG